MSVAANSQSIVVEVRDTSIARGGTNMIPVNVQYNGAVKGILELELKFNAFVIDIKQFDDETPINGFVSNVEYSTDLSDLKNAILRIKAVFLSEVARGNFWVKVEGLAGADTTTFLTPIKAKIDSIDFPVSTLTAGKITVRSSSIIPGINEGLGQNRPNPFSDWTTFNIGLNKESTVKFSVFSLNGKKLLDENNLLEAFKISLMNETGETINDYSFTKIPRGNYRLSLQPYSWMLSSGTYAIILTTESGVYKTNFMYIK
jgi:hypothetical protein